MMHEFLTAHRSELIARCRLKVAQRSAPDMAQDELAHGMTLFLDQLIKTLRLEQTPEPMRSRKVSGPAGGGGPVLSEIGETAAQHGKELLQHGFTVEHQSHRVTRSAGQRMHAHPSPAARAIRTNPAPTTTAPTARATRSPAGARRSPVMAAVTTAIARRSMTPRPKRIAVRPAQQ